MFSIILNNETEFRLLYSGREFKDDLIVTGYFIYSDLSKSDVFTFDNLGDGIYAVEIKHTRKLVSNHEKYGLVLKENGIPKKFEIIQIHD